MAFKEVRRRSILFRPWDSSANEEQVANQVQSSPQATKTASTSIKESSKCFPNVTKGAERINGMTSRTASMNVNVMDSISCHNDSLSSQWPPNFMQQTNHQTNHMALFSRPEMILHPHSSLGFNDNFYHHINNGMMQTIINATSSIPESALMDAPTIARQWRMQQQKKQRPKRFQCPHCRVSFSNNGQLKGHIRIHTGIILVFIFTSNFIIIAH